MSEGVDLDAGNPREIVVPHGHLAWPNEQVSPMTAGLFLSEQPNHEVLEFNKKFDHRLQFDANGAEAGFLTARSEHFGVKCALGLPRFGGHEG